MSQINPKTVDCLIVRSVEYNQITLFVFAFSISTIRESASTQRFMMSLQDNFVTLYTPHMKLK